MSPAKPQIPIITKQLFSENGVHTKRVPVPKLPDPNQEIVTIAKAIHDEVKESLRSELKNTIEKELRVRDEKFLVMLKGFQEESLAIQVKMLGEFKDNSLREIHEKVLYSVQETDLASQQIQRDAYQKALGAYQGALEDFKTKILKDSQDKSLSMQIKMLERDNSLKDQHQKAIDSHQKSLQEIHEKTLNTIQGNSLSSQEVQKEAYQGALEDFKTKVLEVSKNYKHDFDLMRKDLLADVLNMLDKLPSPQFNVPESVVNITSPAIELKPIFNIEASPIDLKPVFNVPESSVKVDLKPVFNVTASPIDLKPVFNVPETNTVINIPKQDPAVVNITSPKIDLKPVFNVPEQKPAEITVHATLEQKPVLHTLSKDEDGKVSGMLEELSEELREEMKETVKSKFDELKTMQKEQQVVYDKKTGRIEKIITKMQS